MTAGPAVEEIWQDFRGSGVVQALDVDCWNGSNAQVQSFANNTGVTFPVIAKGGYLQDPSQYGIAYDDYVVIDKDGIVRYTSVNEPYSTGAGRYNGAHIRAAIQAWLPSGVEGRTWAAVKGLYR
jgi:hypothetical protein